tara:strand:- start:250 stop:462 length:213 start_codon:yes stop_codon:yes gene_type:complete
MCVYTFKKTTIAAISSGLRLMMPLAFYAKDEDLGLGEIAANAVTQGIQEEPPNSINNHLVNQLRGYSHEF